MIGRLQSVFTQNERLSQAAGVVLLAAMAACAALTLDSFSARLSPAWPRGMLPWLGALAAIEAIYSQRLVHDWPELGWRRFSYRISEALVIAAGVKIFFFVPSGLEGARAEIAAYQSGFFDAFFAGAFPALLALTLLLWFFAARATAQLIELGGDRHILEAGARPDFFIDRDAVRRQLAGIVLAFGAFLVFIATLTRSDLALLWTGQPRVEAGGGPVVAYFCLALVLFSQGQFAVMRARWGWERTLIASEISKSWLKYTSLFVLIVLGVVAILPKGYSLDFFTSIGVLFQFLATLIALVFFLISLPFLLLMAVLAGGERPELENPFEEFLQTPPVLPETAGAAGTPAAWFELIRSILFWIALLAVVAYALFQYIRQNEVLWERLMSIEFWRGLYALWQRFCHWFVGVKRGAGGLVKGGLDWLRDAGRGGQAGPAWSFGALAGRSPRARVIFFYRALVRRAGERQVLRRGCDTPDEYAAALRAAFPDAAGEIDVMTAGFETARYSRKPVSRQEVAAVRSAWDRLRARLRQKG